jgi:hypothetical protein
LHFLTSGREHYSPQKSLLQGEIVAVIFRKIGGRIVPITIKGVKDATHDPRMTTLARKIVAKVNGEQIGQMNLLIPKKAATSDVVNVAVEKKFRGHGISRALFKYSQKFLGRIGKKFMRSTELQHVAQVKIRQKAGKTVFVGTGFGPYGEHSVKKKGIRGVALAKDIIKNPGINGRTVSATTMIPKKFRRPKKPR